MIVMLMLLLVHAKDNGCDEPSSDDNKDNDNVTPCCCWFFCYLSDDPTTKVSRFVGFPSKNLRKLTRNSSKHTTISTGFTEVWKQSHSKSKKQNTWNKHGTTKRTTSSYSRKPHKTREFQALDQKNTTDPPRRQTRRLPYSCS